ncbi:MAG: threonine/serine exporter family protein [Lachnospiraceae bacterium]|nr:threonine/serine exporter family protein [Lachnospiraceae bacterium]
MILQVIAATFAVASFSILFSVPKDQCILAALNGGIAWFSYLFLSQLGAGPAVSSLGATLLLTLLARLFALHRKHPVTIYLMAGIFPLVPGSGIYYTSYYFIMSDMESFVAKGTETFKVAGAISLGIIFGFALPQKFLLFARRKFPY